MAHVTPEPEPGLAGWRSGPEQDGAQDPGAEPPFIVLAGLPELYGLGLRHALETAHVGSVVLVDGEDLPSVLSGIGRAVLVVPTDDVEDVRNLAAVVAPEHPALVVEVTAEDSPASFAAALRRGAVGVLQGDTTLAVAVEVIRSASVGCVLVPEHVARELDSPDPLPAAPTLTERERLWLRELSRGTTVAALAASSSYSEREMYRLLSKLYARLGADTRTGALLRAERFGLLRD